jgi:fermentation-respiration switch protein FrsA (DUF1100 family)
VNKILTRILRYAGMLFIAALASVIAWTLILMIFEERFIFFPIKYPGGNYEQQLLKVQDCWFNAEDGVKLHGWYAGKKNSIATIVMSHGNGGNITHRIELVNNLHRAGFNVFLYDYRGYGRSEGSPSEDGLYKDARAAYRYALSLEDVDTSKIILWGTSIGGAFAVEAATHRSPALLILESTFSSGKDIAASLWPYLPVQFLVKSRFNSSERIKDIHCPVLCIHGTNDDIIPIKLGRKLFESANEPKEFYEIRSAGHNDTFHVGRNGYFERIRTFALKYISSSNSRFDVNHP